MVALIEASIFIIAACSGSLKSARAIGFPQKISGHIENQPCRSQMGWYDRAQSWLGLFEQFFRFDKWNACRVQAAAICDSRLK